MEKVKKTRTMSPELLEKLAAARERAAALRAEQKAKKANQVVEEPVVAPIVEPPPEPKVAAPVIEPPHEPKVELNEPKLKRTKKKVVVVASSDDDSSSDEEYVIKIPKKVIKAKKVNKVPIPIPVQPEPQPIQSPEPSSLPQPSFNKTHHLVNLARMGYSF
jgi:hypothetical protein